MAAMMEEMTFRLDHFEGPLDLLLHLISKNKVSIYDIPIAEILEQYMTVLHEAEAMDLDVAGDFIAMAAQLVYIKSKMLLPKYDDEPEEDPRAQLVEQLLEYQRIRQMSDYFREATDRAAATFTLPVESATAEVLYSNADVGVKIESGVATAEFSKPRAYAFVKLN